MYKKYYQSSFEQLGHRPYSETYKVVRFKYNSYRKLTRRRPYIRSKYFKNQKVFFDLFWPHLMQKGTKERLKRMRYFECGIDLIKNSSIPPESKEHPNNKSRIVHRFYGKTINGNVFAVQIQEDKRSGNKWLMSIFPK